MHIRWQGYRRVRARSALLLTLVVVLTAACSVIGASGATALTSCPSGPFTSPGEYCYSVPAGTTAVRVVAVGGGGGTGGGSTWNGRYFAGGAGAAGARVSAYLTGLSPASLLWVEVGGRGSTGGDLPANPSPRADTPGGSGGFNGGGAGGVSKAVPPDPGFGGSPGFPPTGGGAGGGGGATDIRTSACAPSCPGDSSGQAARLLVAGGGGGGGGYNGAPGAGGAGSASGQNGGDGSYGSWFASGGRGGGASNANGGTGAGNYGGGSGGGGGGSKAGTGGGAGATNNTGPGAGGGGGSSFASFAAGASFSSASSVTDGSVTITPVAQTALATTATTPVTIGGQASDTAVLSGGSSPTGTITFKAYGPDDTTCADSPAFTTSTTVSGNGTYTSNAFTPSAAGTYRFVASYGGDDSNSSASGACGDAGETVVVNKVQPTMTTQASGSVTVGGNIQDDAVLSGGSSPTGTITFRAYGPDDATCTGTVQLAATKTVTGNGTYNSGGFPPNVAGTYRFVASYSGDAHNQPVTGGCLDPNESVVVSKAQPSLATTASAPVSVGGQISDEATLSGGHSPTGTLSFSVYGPDNASCSGSPVFTSSATVSGNGGYGSGSFTPTAPGTYRFVTAYSGDANNDAASGSCGDAGESVVVSQAAPSLATTASPGVSAGGDISDQATVSGGHDPGGTLTFTAYGPDDTTCQNNPAFTSTVQVDSGNGTYGSGPFTAALAGTYRFVASYSGDANNAAAGGSCGDAGESVVVSKAQPGLSTSASSDIVVGGQISDQATMTGGAAPSGTITFKAYGPSDSSCQNTPAFTSTAQVSGDGTYNSGPFSPSVAGTYRFVASYDGDANNSSAAGGCGDAGESVVVSQAQPTLATTASGTVGVGEDISDQASLSGGFNPTGTITFQAYGPDDANCTGPVAFTSSAPVTGGNGSYGSGPFTTTHAGTYRFVASYSADVNNAQVTSACIDPSESVVVSKAQPALSTTASSSTPAGGAISDTATLSSGHDPTGTITFDVYGPDDATCSNAPAFTSTAPVSGNDDYQSGDFTPTTVGTYRFVASYGGDADNDGVSGSCGDQGESVAVSPRDTETSISCPDGVTGDAESCAVTVKDVDSGPKTNPTGTVTLSTPGGGGTFDSSTCTLAPVSGSSDASRCDPAPAYTPTAAGTDNVQADYGGDATHANSGSGQADVAVAKHATSTSISCPGGAVGDTESCTVSVRDTNAGSETNPSGSVDLSAPGAHGSFDASSCVLQPVSGSSDTSRCDPPPSYTPADAGTNEVKADYGGDSTHSTSSSDATDVDVARHDSETSIACPDGVVGDPQPCTVTVKDANGGSKTNPTGGVDLSAPDGNGSFGSSSCDLQPVSGSSDTSACDPAPAYTAAAAGANKVKADYAGDPTHAPSGSGEQDVAAAKHSSTTSVSCTPGSVVAGSSTTCTATVSDGRSGNPPRPGGTVTFTTGSDGSFGSGGSCTLPASGDNSCQVTYTAGSAGPGTHAIGGAYSGDRNHSASHGRADVGVTPPSTPAAQPQAQAPGPDGFSLSHRNPLIRNGRALIRLRCNGPRGSVCKGLLVLTSSRLSTRLSAAALHKTSVRFTVAAGHSKVLWVRLPKASRGRLRHLRKAVAFASVTLDMPDGHATTRRRAITIVRR